MRLVCCRTTAIEKSWRTSAISSSTTADTVHTNAAITALPALRINRRSRRNPATTDATVA